MPGAKIWHLLPHDADRIQHLSRRLGISPIVAQLLINRNIDQPEQAKTFLQAGLSGLHEPELLPGVEEAAGRLLAAVRAGRRVCIFGDYDVDGVSGTAILWNCLKLLGARPDAIEIHIPHRLQEGYGLNGDALRKLAANGVQIVVTVDCGIASVAEAELARSLGLELIVTDHHEPKAELPSADVLVHPRLSVGQTFLSADVQRQAGKPAPHRNNGAARYPFGQLCGAGVAFKLAWALCRKSCGSAKVTAPLREFLLDAVVLAALGTVADVMPLSEENRILVRYGLERMCKQPGIGMLALLRGAGLETKAQLVAGDIGFTLAPRINAAGRLGTARAAVDLLTTLDSNLAKELAEHLENQNQQRQALERAILQEARQRAAEFSEAAAFVLAQRDWHPGLLGIVASRLVDEFARPALMIALSDEKPHGQGSGRSVPGFRLHEALDQCAARLLSHGGHATAAGFRIAPEAIDPFRDEFCQIAARELGPTPKPRRLVIDAELPLSSLTFGLVEAIRQLEPYGQGNPEPLFLADRLKVLGEPRCVGNGERHLSFRVRQEGRDIRAIGFNMADRAQELMSCGGECCLVFTPRIGEWRDYRIVEIEARDLQAGPQARLG